MVTSTNRAAAFGRAHVEALAIALTRTPTMLATIERWGQHLAMVLAGGGRLLAAGNGGSAAQAQHLTAELVGRYLDERKPFSALALHAETSTLTAIVNDYGIEEAFARQVRAHGRPGDVFLALSTSGKSQNVLAAARAADAEGLAVWGMTGRAPNPLADVCHEVIAVDADLTCTVQEIHLVLLHVLCEAVDLSLAESTATTQTLSAAAPTMGAIAGGRL